MNQSAGRYHAALEHARLDTDGCRLFRPQLTLFADRISLTGWRWRGRFRRDITLDEIANAVTVAPDRLDLLLTSGETLPLMLLAADHWRQAILAHRDVAR